MTLTKLLVPTCTQMLGALSGWLQKAQDQLPQESWFALGRLLTSSGPELGLLEVREIELAPAAEATSDAAPAAG